MKKVLIITYYWPPSGGAGVQRWLKFSKYLPKFGYEPVVLTVDPEKATHPVKDDSLIYEIPEDLKVYYTSTIEPFNYYKRIFKKKQVPYSGFAYGGEYGTKNIISRFIRGNFFIPDARVGWNRNAIGKVRELIEDLGIETIITTSPPHSTQLIGLKIKKLFPSIYWIVDLRDPWTDIFYYEKMLHLPFVKKTDKRLEKNVLLNADLVITVSNHLQKIFKSKVYDEIDKPFEVIYNGYDSFDFTEISEKNDESFFTITYTGTISEVYDISGLICALKGVANFLKNKIKIRFVGYVCEKWKNALEQEFTGNLSFSSHVSHSEAVAEMQQANLLLLVIPRITQCEGIITGKIFEYLASTRPIIGIGPPKGDASEIIQSTGGGKMFHWHDHVSIEKYILDCATNKTAQKTNMQKVAEFSRKAQTKRLVELIKNQDKRRE